MVPTRGNRIVFQLNDEEAERLEHVIAAAEMPRADHLRQVLLRASEATTESTSAHIRVLEEALQDTGSAPIQRPARTAAPAVPKHGEQSHKGAPGTG